MLHVDLFLFQLSGYSQPVTLQVFIGTDSGKLKPHGFYQACKVCSKNATACSEESVDNTCVIKIELDPKEDMTAVCVCLKRTSDV